mmetsp:Transcript_2734/g.4921  ORF Transcript_2734/g.4921 Transcript_2734/m.4921 type:complete len:114 (-) Transcript_2734:512-853(-)
MTFSIVDTVGPLTGNFTPHKTVIYIPSSMPVNFLARSIPSPLSLLGSAPLYEEPTKAQHEYASHDRANDDDDRGRPVARRVVRNECVLGRVELVLHPSKAPRRYQSITLAGVV